MDSKAEKYRRLMIEAVEQTPAETGLLISGGMDSGTILAAMLALGRKPQLVTFHLAGHMSSDVRVSVRMADAFNLKLETVVIPRSEHDLVDTVLEIMKLFQENGTKFGKVRIQCAHAIKVLSERLAKVGCTIAADGTPGIVEDNKRIYIILHKHGEQRAREYRKEQLDGHYDSSSGTFIDVAAHYGVKLYQPFMHQPLTDYALSLDMEEINRGRQKGIALRAFPEFWKTGSWWRKNSSLQVNGGLREYHDTLLKSAYNTHKWKLVLPVYKEIYRREIERMAHNN